MRTRSRIISIGTGIDNVETCIFDTSFPHWPVGSVHDYVDPYPYVHTAQFMQDERRKGAQHYNVCRNAKVVRDYGRYEFDTRYDILPRPIIDGYSNISAGTKAYDFVPNSLIIKRAQEQLFHRTAPPDDELTRRIDELKPLFGDSRLMSSMPIRSDPFDTDFSIWYLLVDLLDAKKLVKNVITSLTTSGRRYRPPRVRSSKGGLVRDDRTARQMHDAHLLTRFGILPTIKDIQDLVRVIQHWKRVLREASSGEASLKRYVTHQNVTDLKKIISSPLLDDWEENVSITLPMFELGSPLSVKVESKNVASWHAQALYGFVCPELHGWVSRLAQICESFGLYDPAAAWDVIPFSFIIDWFYSVSDWLHKNRPRLFRATPILYDYLETIKIQNRVTYTLTAPYVTDVSPYYEMVTHQVGTELYTLYDRERFNPPPGHIVLAPRTLVRNGESFVSISNKIAISSSLIAQRLPR